MASPYSYNCLSKIASNVSQICEVAWYPEGVDKYREKYIILFSGFVKGNLGEAKRNRIICCYIKYQILTVKSFNKYMDVLIKHNSEKR